MYSKFKVHGKLLHHFVQDHAIVVCIIILATFLRVYNLHTHGIFFFDAGHDLIAAHQAFQEGHIPLVGITSSRPWLHQGPLAIWIEMLGMLFFGREMLAQQILFALIGIAAVIGLYELITVHYSRRAAYIAVALLAVFPLAVANSRVPYHTTPIPLATVLYLWAVVGLWNRFSIKQLVLTLLSGILLFQFELCNAPLLAIIPYVFIRRRYLLSKQVLAILFVSGLVGLLPQLLFHVFGGSNQVLEFAKWFIAQILERIQGGSQTVHTATSTLQAYWLFGGRIFGVDQPISTLLGFGSVIASSLYVVYRFYSKQSVPALIEVSLIGMWLLIGAYFIGGPPSEAYFPPFYICIPILISYTIVLLKPKLQMWATALVIVYMVATVYSIFAANFFVMNNRAFQYDSVGEQRAIAHTVAKRSNYAPYKLATVEGSEVQFAAFFDHIKWLTIADGLPTPSDTGKTFYIEKNGDPPPPQSVVIESFPTKTVYRKLGVE